MGLFWWRKRASQQAVTGSDEHHCPTTAQVLDLVGVELDAAERAVPVAQFNTRRGYLLEKLVDARQRLNQDPPEHRQAQSDCVNARYWANSWMECAEEHRQEVEAIRAALDRLTGALSDKIEVGPALAAIDALKTVVEAIPERRFEG